MKEKRCGPRETEAGTGEGRKRKEEETEEEDGDHQGHDQEVERHAQHQTRDGRV